jgi:hypothetical protein
MTLLGNLSQIPLEADDDELAKGDEPFGRRAAKGEPRDRRRRR